MDMAVLDRSLESISRTLWHIVWRHKIIFALTSAIVFAAIILGMLALQPLYEGTTLLIGGQLNPEPTSGQVNLEPLPAGARKLIETPTALSRIAESEEVVSAAIEKIGLETLVEHLGPNSPSLFARLRRFVFPSLAQPPRDVAPIEAYLPGISRRLGVSAEPNADIIRIAFRHPDPVIAARFANAVAQAVIEQEIQLYSRPGAADFFMRQRQHFDAELARASDELEKFSTWTAIYSAADQRRLLLRRLNDLSSAMAITRGSISEKTGERQALAETLRKLAPVARSSYVSSLVDALGGERNAARVADPRTLDERTSDPPLLLIRVYQDSMAMLFKINSELAGAQSLLQQQNLELEKLTLGLNALSENEQQFANFKRAVDQARYNSDLYSKRMVEEQINAEANKARFASAKVMQKATVPLRPVFPNYVVITIAAGLGSMLAGAGGAMLRSGSGSVSRKGLKNRTSI